MKWPALTARVAVKRKLRDNQRAASYIQERAIHFSLIVFKDSQVAIFSAMLAAMADVSLRPTPIKITRPVVISPVTRPSTVTRARLTRWTTARIFQYKIFSSKSADANRFV